MVKQLNYQHYDKDKLALMLDSISQLTYPRLRSLLARTIKRRRFVAYALDVRSIPSKDSDCDVETKDLDLLLELSLFLPLLLLNRFKVFISIMCWLRNINSRLSTWVVSEGLEEWLHLPFKYFKYRSDTRPRRAKCE